MILAIKERKHRTFSFFCSSCNSSGNNIWRDLQLHRRSNRQLLWRKLQSRLRKQHSSTCIPHSRSFLIGDGGSSYGGQLAHCVHTSVHLLIRFAQESFLQLRSFGGSFYLLISSGIIWWLRVVGFQWWDILRPKQKYELWVVSSWRLRHWSFQQNFEATLFYGWIRLWNQTVE